MIDQFNSRKLLDFNLDFVHNVCGNTQDNRDPNWDNNVDPFGEGALAIVWGLLGSKTRTPGRYNNPPVNTPNSVTNETIHFSVREKMEQIAKPDTPLPLPLPSTALTGFEYDEDQKGWIYDKGKQGQFQLSEFPLPSAKDEDSVQSWLCGDWLKGQET
jgi:hypothetical protein